MRLPDPSPVLDKNRAPMGPEILSSTAGGGVWSKAPMAFPDSSSVLEKVQSATLWRILEHQSHRCPVYSENTGPNFIHPPTPENTLLGVEGV